MRIRKRCLTHGHKYRVWASVPLPVEFCTRWFCDGARVASWVPEPMREALNMVLAERQFHEDA